MRKKKIKASLAKPRFTWNIAINKWCMYIYICIALGLGVIQSLLRCGRVAKYSDEYVSFAVCSSVSLFVCLSACITWKLHGQSSSYFLCMLPVTRSFSDGIAIRYVLSGFTDDVIVVLRRSPHGGKPTNQAWATRRPASSQAVLVSRQSRTRDVSQARPHQWTKVSSQHLHKLVSGRDFSQAATMLWLCGGLSSPYGC